MSSATPLRRPHHLRDLGALGGRVQHVVTDGRRQLTGIGVVQPAAVGERHRADQAHARA